MGRRGLCDGHHLGGHGRDEGRLGDRHGLDGRCDRWIHDPDELRLGDRRGLGDRRSLGAGHDPTGRRLGGAGIGGIHDRDHLGRADSLDGRRLVDRSVARQASVVVGRRVGHGGHLGFRGSLEVRQTTDRIGPGDRPDQLEVGRPGDRVGQASDLARVLDRAQADEEDLELVAIALDRLGHAIDLPVDDRGVLSEVLLEPVTALADLDVCLGADALDLHLAPGADPADIVLGQPLQLIGLDRGAHPHLGDVAVGIVVDPALDAQALALGGRLHRPSELVAEGVGGIAHVDGFGRLARLAWDGLVGTSVGRDVGRRHRGGIGFSRDAVLVHSGYPQTGRR